jgi:hypothetical protein
MWIRIESSDCFLKELVKIPVPVKNSSSVKEASGDQVNDYLLVSQHMNVLTGPAGYLKRSTAPMKAIVGESLAWLPVLQLAKNKTHTARRNMTVYCVQCASITLSQI